MGFKKYTAAAVLAVSAMAAQERVPSQTMRGVPKDAIVYSPPNHYHRGSYTFEFGERGECAYRTAWSTGFPSDTEPRARRLEFEVMRWQRAKRTGEPLKFKTSSKTTEGCYVIDEIAWR